MTLRQLIIEMLLFLFQSKSTLPQTGRTFKALVDSIVPDTGEQASVQSQGALAAQTDEYLIWILDHYVSLKLLGHVSLYLANATAKMLNEAAGQLISLGGNDKPINLASVSEEVLFAVLEATDRCRTLTLLEQLKADLTGLPVPFYNNPETVVPIISILSMLSTNGFYSEWSGYGSTRLNPPGERKIEHFPAGWQQIGYPGPSKGYHALRGYIIEKFTEQEGSA